MLGGTKRVAGEVAWVLAPVRGAWVAGLVLGCAANDRAGYVPRIKTKNGSFSAARGQSPGDGTQTQAPSAIEVGLAVGATLAWLWARTVGPDSRDITPNTFFDDIR